ncbi:hypothetical protein, partial [Segatella buccae]|uniref:hypothetical protein n=1 Tax=Segatella buccae TaxID=28126 RepID=UPI0006603C95
FRGWGVLVHNFSFMSYSFIENWSAGSFQFGFTGKTVTPFACIPAFANVIVFVVLYQMSEFLLLAFSQFVVFQCCVFFKG